MVPLPIETERTTLRALVDTDLDAVHAILGDPVTTAAVSFGQPHKLSTAGWMERRQEDQRRAGVSMYAVICGTSGTMVGLCGFLPRTLPEVELGYVIRADHWGRGLATEAVSAVLTAAAHAGLRVMATIRPSNLRSLAVARRVGLSEVSEISDDRGRLLVFERDGRPA